MKKLLPTLLIAFLGAWLPAAVLRVGAGQPFATIGQALLAAAPGDLILVDPGTYPAFTVTLPVTIAASSVSFAVMQGSGIAAIAIVGTAGTVVIDGARISLAQPNSPAVSITGCPGDVRLQNVFVDASANLNATSARAAIEVANCAVVVLERVTVNGTALRSGRSTNPDGANDGLCAVRFADTQFVLRSCLLRGYDAPSGGAFGGDAVRVVATGAHSPPSCWLLADAGQTLIGGSASGSGGNCLHLIGAGLLAELCNLHILAPGSGGTRNGGFFAINNDGGAIAPGVGRMIPACVLEMIAVTAAPAVVAPGAPFQIDVADFAGGALCMLFVSLGTEYRHALPGVVGRILLDLSTSMTLGIGITPAVFPVTVPGNAGLAGLQLVAQSAVFSPNGWPVTVTSWPAFLSVR